MKINPYQTLLLALLVMKLVRVAFTKPMMSVRALLGPKPQQRDLRSIEAETDLRIAASLREIADKRKAGQ